MARKEIQVIKDQPMNRNTYIEGLVELGYERVNMVIESGTYAVRGSIVDVFPVNQNQPIRCDYFGDDIERMSSFRVDNQKSIRDISETIIKSVDSVVVNRLSFDARVMDSELISNINEGDYVVHEKYGIGKFAGFCRLTVAGTEGEYVLIHYRGNDKLYMPLDQIPLLHKFVGSDSKPRLNGLYDGSWNKTRHKAHREIRVLAEDIYRLYKERQTVKGFSFGPDTEAQLVFESNVPFKETEGQLAAIRAVKQDMESWRPMDRLVCGDVGFGKTEVLLRAAVKAVLNLKQVLVLVPTTILAEQHYTTFSKRCAEMDINIACVSRLKSPKLNKGTLEKVASHQIDIVIGTHRLLQKDVKFKDLGLIIIDEEQRFGVNHKEKLKKIAVSVDVLTASATPIPRTLYMSLTGSKSMSQLNSPPPGRRPIQTIVSEYSEELIADAIKTEYERNGQVYFLHNIIDQLDTIKAQLNRLMPDIKVRIAHGRMSATELEDVMVSFYRHEFDVLLCTTIIENGLDIQNVNTVIINRADRLGLSQIHQIRGRVGRCSIQAYAYILVPKADGLTIETKKRLQVLKEAVGLGVGYQLAMKDLEIRGAGTLLGEKQSGHLTSIGFDLYCKLLDRYLKTVRGKPIEDNVLMSLKDTPNVFIPESYVEDSQQRFALYRRFLNVKNKSHLYLLKRECEDRFGKLPKQMIDFISAIETQLY